MDRQIVYPGAIPLDTDFLSTNRNTLVAISALTRATLGTGMGGDLGAAWTTDFPLQATSYGIPLSDSAG
jgi:hypothetical protein